MNTTDYIFCEDCNIWVDLWKYDSIEDTGHAQCHWRYARPEELPDLIRDCKDSGCFREQGLCPDCITPLARIQVSGRGGMICQSNGVP